MGYIISTVNSLEVIDLEEMVAIKEFNKFEHEIDYLIGC